MSAALPSNRSDSRPAIAATIAPLVASGACIDVRAALAWSSEVGFRGVQISALEPGLRPRDLSASARRDFAGTLARHELQCAGIDFFLPPAHLTDPAHAARAFDAIEATLEFAAQLGRAPVTLPLGPRVSCELRPAIAASADRLGVRVLLPATEEADLAAMAEPFAASIDCASVLAAGARPEELVSRSGAHLGGVRIVDLWRSGLRGPIAEPHESRLDALALRMAVETARFRGLCVLDARQWLQPRTGLQQSLARWNGLLPA
jgi:hypothetical protein